MQTHYYTKHGSVYIYRADDAGGQWFRRDRAGTQILLAGAIHLTRRRLQDLLAEYPRSATDSSVCFGTPVAEEFFDDAKREHLTETPDGTETRIFYLIQKGDDKFSLGYSSTVQRFEKQTATVAESASAQSGRC
jgi:hypothetical protein